MGKTIVYDVNVQNFVKVVVDSSLHPESNHDYSNHMDETQVYPYEGATQLKVDFSNDTLVENICDHIIIYDDNDTEIASYTNDELAGQTLTMEGDTIKIRLTSDGSVTYYGYSINTITAYMEPTDVQDMETFSDNGEDVEVFTDVSNEFLTEEVKFESQSTEESENEVETIVDSEKNILDSDSSENGFEETKISEEISIDQ